jgi:hypothetical protein
VLKYEPLLLQFTNNRDAYAKEGQKISRKYFPADTDFLHLSIEEHLDILGPRGMQEEFDHEKRQYEVVRKFSKTIKDLLDKNSPWLNFIIANGFLLYWLAVP